MRIKKCLFISLIYLPSLSLASGVFLKVNNTALFGHRYLVSTVLQPKGAYKQYMTFSKDGKKLSIEVISGAHKGLHDHVNLYTHKIAKGIWFVNWLALKNTAAKGNTISYVFNLNDSEVSGFFTLNAKTKGGPRRAQTATGSFKLIKQT